MARSGERAQGSGLGPSASIGRGAGGLMGVVSAGI